ncbi:sensor histidine kinase [Variovorax saccharolyticus]|uniref:sensor histidine kinase n=1 Tax=Variovorax saccharolyticus TaxID=3053516 RepID=UPI0025791844|nr:histidine kinase [Variovorax sp. J31P216]MDM0029116.1 histidine kinase [Variovorax sp. J31P216]
MYETTVVPAIIFYVSGIFVLAVLVISTFLAAKGNRAAAYFLWVWAGLLVLILPFITNFTMISSVAAGVILVFLLYVLYMAVQYGLKRVDVSHEETRRVLAESNRRIDEERRALARRLHDEVNPELLLVKFALQQLEPLLKDNEKASSILASALSTVSKAYTQTREIIKNTRIEVIDSIGFTAALESLVGHQKSFFDKPIITLDHNLPKRPELPETIAISAYKIIREALLNAIKHANANKVSVTVMYSRSLGRYKVEIVDDGVGMRGAPKNDEVSGIGLIDMRERARVLGGELKVHPLDARNLKRPGTRVSFSFSAQ